MAAGKILTAGVLILIVLSTHGASAATLSVPDDFTTIASAIDVAKSGDQIQIEPGYYTEYGFVLPAGVVMAGMGDDPSDTIIDAKGKGSIIRSFDGSALSIVFNLTLKNGLATGESTFDKSGGAIFVNQGNLRILKCDFVGNRAEAHGGAIRCIQSSPEISLCNFLNNNALTGGGGALDCSYNSSPIIEDCTFTGNNSAWGGALACRGNSSPEVIASIFYHNQVDGNLAYGGGVLTFFDSSPEFRLCTFYDNRADFGGAMANLPGSPAMLSYCTIVDNFADEGSGLFSRDAATSVEASIIVFHDGTGITGTGTERPEVSCSNIHGNSSGDLVGLAEGLGLSNGNISADPMFCSANATGGIRFTLDQESPSAAAGIECGVMGAWVADCTDTRGIQPIAEMPRILTIENVSAAPNPFNPSTRIYFELESNQRILAEIYSIDGRRVRVLADGVYSAGENFLTWNGNDGSGKRAGSGTYLVRIKGEAVEKTRKITLLK